MNKKLCRRAGLQCLGVAGIALVVRPAFSGSYLTRAAVLLAAGETEARALRKRLHDKALAEMTHRLALERVAAAREMPVPEEVVRAHPHLLLVLEAYERAADAAVRGAHEAFLLSLQRARQERGTFDSVLKQLGWKLPEV